MDPTVRWQALICLAYMVWGPVQTGERGTVGHVRYVDVSVRRCILHTVQTRVRGHPFPFSLGHAGDMAVTV
jgi:hypothetical protein